MILVPASGIYSDMQTLTHLEAHQLGCIRLQKRLFEPVNFTVQPGTVMQIDGPNGIGKSSLLRIIAGTATPAEGDIRWNGHSIQDSLVEYSEQIHYIAHTNGIRHGLTIAENLRLAGELSQQPIHNMDAVLGQLQLIKLKNTQTQFLSAGQKRRTALARLLLIPRPLWILDEPLTSLDTATQDLMLAKINEHLDQGGLCIMTSHHPVILKHDVQMLKLSSC